MKTMYLVRSGATQKQIDQLRRFFDAKDNITKVYTSGISRSIQTATAMFPKRPLALMSKLCILGTNTIEVATGQLELAMRLACNRMWENKAVVVVGDQPLVETVLPCFDERCRVQTIETGDVVQLTFRRGGFFDAVRLYKQPFLQ